MATIVKMADRVIRRVNWRVAACYLCMVAALGVLSVCRNEKQPPPKKVKKAALTEIVDRSPFFNVFPVIYFEKKEEVVFEKIIDNHSRFIVLKKINDEIIYVLGYPHKILSYIISFEKINKNGEKHLSELWRKEIRYRDWPHEPAMWNQLFFIDIIIFEGKIYILYYRGESGEKCFLEILPETEDEEVKIIKITSRRGGLNSWKIYRNGSNKFIDLEYYYEKEKETIKIE